MNLSKLFEMQAELDEHIINTHKDLVGQRLIDKKILALLVELGELANEWRGFKFWSNKAPSARETILEEYVDCLHFLLSISLEKGYGEEEWNLSIVEGLKMNTIGEQFLMLFNKIGDYNSIQNKNNFAWICPLFIGLGEMLGFTHEQIEQAYLEKNTINHQRQESGY